MCNGKRIDVLYMLLYISGQEWSKSRIERQFKGECFHTQISKVLNIIQYSIAWKIEIIGIVLEQTEVLMDDGTVPYHTLVFR